MMNAAIKRRTQSGESRGVISALLPTTVSVGGRLMESLSPISPTASDGRGGGGKSASGFHQNASDFTPAARTAGHKRGMHEF